MNIVAASTRPKVLMTVEEFFALPDDGVHRELIRGELRIVRQESWDDPDAPLIPVARAERPMTVRNRMHCRVEAKFAMFLGIWVEAQPEPRGEVLSGECGFRLGGPGTSAIGIDVALVTAEMKASIPPGQSIYDGPPLLAVEILSPYDTQKAIAEMIDLYLESGVLLWIAHPDLRAISVHRIGEVTGLFNEAQDLVGDPYISGFRVPVSRFFS